LRNQSQSPCALGDASRCPPHLRPVMGKPKRRSLRMIARSFKPVGWVAAVGVAALGCYMLSLRVAAERADLTRLDQRIVSAAQQIRSLQTELGTRGRMQQLEQWNDEVLALSAPVSGQFVGGNASLARFDIRQPQLADQTAEVRLASAETQPATPAAPVAVQAAAAQHAVAPPAAAPQPLVRRASLTVTPPAAAPLPAPARIAAAETPARPAALRTPPAPERKRPAPAPTRTASADEHARPAAQPARPRAAGLLDDRTMRDLGAVARSERGGGARN
jgi:hypothetical protein